MQSSDRYYNPRPTTSGGRDYDARQRVAARNILEEVVENAEPEVTPEAYTVPSYDEVIAVPMFDQEHTVPTRTFSESFKQGKARAASIVSVNEKWLKYGVPVFAALLIGVGLGLTALSFYNNQKVQEQLSTYAAEASDSGEQSSAVVAAGDDEGTNPESTITDPRQPRHIAIEKAGVSASMTVVGVNSKGNIGSPASIKQASWYSGSSSPLDTGGSALIVAHVGTDRLPGAFANVHTLEKGDTITLTMGDNSKVFYTVSSLESVPTSKMDMADYLKKPGGSAHELHLITCDGDYNARSHTYSDRLVVTATR